MFGIDQGLPENPYITTTSEDVLDKFDGQKLIYNPHSDFDITHPDTTWIYNDYGYLFNVRFDEKDQPYIGGCRTDIEKHNKLTAAEKLWRRNDPDHALPVPPPTPPELATAEYFYRPPSPETDPEPPREDSTSEKEDDPTTQYICHSPIEPTMTTQTAHYPYHHPKRPQQHHSQPTHLQEVEGEASHPQEKEANHLQEVEEHNKQQPQQHKTPQPSDYAATLLKHLTGTALKQTDSYINYAVSTLPT